MAKIIAGLVVLMLSISFSGCANITLPEKIEVGHGGGSQKVDSSRVPQTRNHEECRQELIKAYAYIRNLERRNQKLEKDKAELKASLKRYKKQYDD
jgi:hypothetical protein